MSFFSSLFSCCIGTRKQIHDEKQAQTQSEADARHARIMSAYTGDGDIEAQREHDPFTDPFASPLTLTTNTPALAFPPPAYTDITRDRQLLYPVDEKSPRSIAHSHEESQRTQTQSQYQYMPTTQMQAHPHHPFRTRPHSDSVSNSIPTYTSSRPSSIISVPSTRLSDLTSMHTGTTRRMRARTNAAVTAAGSEADHLEPMTWPDTDNDTDSGFFGSGSEQSAPPSYYAGSERSITPVQMHMGVWVGDHHQHPVMTDGWLDGLIGRVRAGTEMYEHQNEAEETSMDHQDHSQEQQQQTADLV